MALGYREAVQWIAYNDDAGSADAYDVDAVRHYITVKLIADVAGKETEEVAKAVVAERVRARRAEKRGER